MSNILKQHSVRHHDEPFFILFSSQSIHSPFQVPDIYQNMYRSSKNKTLSLTKKVGLVFSETNYELIYPLIFNDGNVKRMR